MKVVIKVLYDNGVEKSYEQNNIEEDKIVEMQNAIFNVVSDIFKSPGIGGSLIIDGIGVINLSKICSIEIKKKVDKVNNPPL